MSVAIEEQNKFNLTSWDKLLADAELAKLPYRIESNEFGQAVMSPLLAPSHGRRQFKVANLLQQLMNGGEVITECPISTLKGVKGADVVWCQDELWAKDGEKSCFMSAPAICVEVISPSNTDAEMNEKKQLYINHGAKEVWFVSTEGEVSFYSSSDLELTKSELCADFPKTI